MAVAVYCFTVVVPLSSIERGYKGGLLAFFAHVHDSIGKRVWFDDKLVAISCYAPDQACEEECRWRELGFLPSTTGSTGKMNLVCAQVDQKLGILNRQVDWLEYERASASVWLKGSDRGRTAGPEHVLRTQREDHSDRDRVVKDWLNRWGPDEESSNQ